ncbi:hypothetical protein Poly51_21840 [Rubripirellula tenax]|uniref:Ser-Thr-rich glycosyl-phosphatidyl-inositol-anchored membrane family protein n=2 Tax=Rubripirellula tenax TaxID=2528015 RepID=A0A5C6FH90_9BACT|nr:hypothetical protein Poly51_21840 [Rubripirellula tenax]
MQIAKKAKLLAVLAAIWGVGEIGSTFGLIGTGMSINTSMLINTASAVEVSGSVASASIEPVLAAPSPDSFVLGSRTFTIPYTIDVTGNDAIEVQLFVSRGPSDAWKLIESKRPDRQADGSDQAKQFEFTAGEDGEYWFATRTAKPTGLATLSSTVSPQLKVFVDTAKPRAEVVAEADADGHVDVQMLIEDATPLKTMQLRYFTDTDRTWQEVDLTQLPADGRIGFTPSKAWQQLSLQLVVTDTAGNQNFANKLVQLPRIAEAPPEHRYAMLPGGVDARATPYRLRESEAVDAMAVSGPVIALDRRRAPQKQQHATAHGYAQGYSPATAAPQRGLNNFRGAAFPGPQGNGGALPSPSIPELIPPPEPASMTDQLFAPPSRPTQTPPANTPPIDAPSIYATPAPFPTSPEQVAPGPAESILPPPASLDQITSGFGLAAPSNPAAPESIPAPDGQADPNARKIPESIPAPTADEAPTLGPSRTLSEAMRPLSEQSAVPPKREDTPAPSPRLSPKPPVDYRSARPNAPEPSSLSARVPVRYSEGLRFSLAYELEAVGSQGVDAIELYGSVDEGRSWKLWGSDPDRSSPFDIETREEGVFGYRIVVVGKNGLASPRPLSGETPDIVVVVDTQVPTVRITGARYGEGDRVGALVILYECEDSNLMARPIALSFGPSTDGPWTTIAAGLSNDGDYVWPADPQLPRQFYLRIDATDQAGNVGTYILDKPIDAQGLAPRARIRGFQSISGAAPDASFK